ncbi:MAG: zinc ribbon domain-containing protein [Planctomycetes bacterium]|nr:zinc ribbon domain-containing protein [Planctomycetota bacterium]
MPTYDYECGRCEHRFEKYQGINDPAVRKCPKCGRLSVKRLVGAGAALLFKGSGFYITDYRSKDYQAKAKADSSAAAGSSSATPAASPAPASAAKTPAAATAAAAK